ncbi:MAG: CPBP family intramembrane glutamic endopeptidase [Bryobacteraceae bacterium]
MYLRGQRKQAGWTTELSAYWRELLFWLLLLPAFGALGSIKPRNQIAGLIEACAFLLIAISSTGKLKSLGLEFAHWNRVGTRIAVLCALAGMVAGGVIVAVACLSDRSLGVEQGWNRVILAVSLGPVLEEVIFRGYLLTAMLVLTGRLWPSRSASVSIIGIAVVFSTAHLATPGMKAIQLGCIGSTGCLYGYIRVRFRSTAAAALAHAMYNLALYVSCWIGIAR